jgi:hypothetical protein
VRGRLIKIVFITAVLIATVGWVWLLFYGMALFFSP